ALVEPDRVGDELPDRARGRALGALGHEKCRSTWGLAPIMKIAPGPSLAPTNGWRVPAGQWTST
ncbi:MAG TPA: hypothetical protein VE615_11635, partial [Gaiellaceae bacterium]|nr:hypothetical protein [Gaiellaceae bacterium]